MLPLSPPCCPLPSSPTPHPLCWVQSWACSTCLVNQELNTSWGLGDEAWVGSIQIHIEKSPALEEQLSGPFPAADGARRRSGLGNLTAEEQPGNLAGDRENEPCGSGPAPSKADSRQTLSSQTWGPRWGGSQLCLLRSALRARESGRQRHWFGSSWLSLRPGRAGGHRNCHPKGEPGCVNCAPCHAPIPYRVETACPWHRLVWGQG